MMAFDAGLARLYRCKAHCYNVCFMQGCIKITAQAIEKYLFKNKATLGPDSLQFTFP